MLGLQDRTASLSCRFCSAGLSLQSRERERLGPELQEQPIFQKSLRDSWITELLQLSSELGGCNSSACLPDPFSIFASPALYPRTLTPSDGRVGGERGQALFPCPPCLGSCDVPHLRLPQGGPSPMLWLSADRNAKSEKAVLSW